MFENSVRFLVYALSVFISCKYAAGYWVVGPAFGFAVVCWDSRIFKKFVPLKHGAYLAASTLIYALVYTIASQDWRRGSELADSLFGSLPIAIVAGSILLPLAHKLFLTAKTKALAETIPLLILSYYILLIISLADDTWHLGWDFNYLYLNIGIWQVIYLRFLSD